MKKAGLFILCLLICFAACGLGSLVTLPQIHTWYASLKKPVFNPPDAIFGPVWTVLYFLMSIALYQLLVSTHPGRRKAIRAFSVQLALNVVWSFIFFGLHLLIPAAVEIVVLLVLIIYFLVISRPVSKIASACFIPYVIWVSFATLLSISVALLN